MVHNGFLAFLNGGVLAHRTDSSFHLSPFSSLLTLSVIEDAE